MTSLTDSKSARYLASLIISTWQRMPLSFFWNLKSNYSNGHFALERVLFWNIKAPDESSIAGCPDAACVVRC